MEKEYAWNNMYKPHIHIMKQKKPDTVYMCSMITYVGSS